MNKYFLLFVALLLGTATLRAQPKVETSTSFDEPDNGWNKLLQLKNGNTFFFHFDKDGIEVTVYDKSRKQLAHRTLTSDLWDAGKMKESRIEGLYEINGDPTIFLLQPDGNVPTLYRIRLNPANGAKKKESVIAKLNKVSIWQAYASMYGNADQTDLYIEKDPLSDCYAVVEFNAFVHNRDERIKLTHYDGNDAVISKANYDSPDGMFKYLRFLGMAVDGSKAVYITVYGFNTESSGGKDSRVIVARLDAKATSFTNKMLDFTEDFHDTKAILQYNHNSGMLQLFSLTYGKTKHKLLPNQVTTYFTMMTYIDPGTLEIVAVKPVIGEKVDAYAQNQLHESDGYSGVPQQMILNKDNTTTVLSENINQEVRRNQHGMVVSEITYLGPIGISVINENGTEKDGYAILKRQKAEGLLDPFYISEKGKGQWSYRKGWAASNAFLSFDYIDGDKYDYVLLNDLSKNFDRDEDEKKKTIYSVSNTNTICYRLNNGQLDKFYLFGDPKDEDKANFCYIESSDFQKNTNTYATLLVTRNGRDKTAKVAWVTFE